LLHFVGNKGFWGSLPFASKCGSKRFYSMVTQYSALTVMLSPLSLSKKNGPTIPKVPTT